MSFLNLFVVCFLYIITGCALYYGSSYILKHAILRRAYRLMEGVYVKGYIRFLVMTCVNRTLDDEELVNQNWFLMYFGLPLAIWVWPIFIFAEIRIYRIVKTFVDMMCVQLYKTFK